MRLKIITLSILLLILGSCKEKVTITSDNYLYEGNFYQNYLNTSIRNVNMDIASLEEAMQANDSINNEVRTKLAKRKKSLADFTSELNKAKGFGVVLPPRPPCPSIPNGGILCFPGNGFLIANKDIVSIAIEVLNENQEKAGTISGKLANLPGNKDQARFMKYSLSGVSGNVSLKFTVTDTSGKTITYTSIGNITK